MSNYVVKPKLCVEHAFYNVKQTDVVRPFGYSRKRFAPLKAVKAKIIKKSKESNYTSTCNFCNNRQRLGENRLECESQ